MLLWCVHVQYMTFFSHWSLEVNTMLSDLLTARIAGTCSVWEDMHKRIRTVRMYVPVKVREHCSHAHALYWQTCTQGTDLYIRMCVHTIPPSIFYILYTTALTRCV